MHHDIGGNYKLIAAVISGTIHKQQDELPGYFLAKVFRKIWKHSVSGAGMIR